MAPGDKKWDDVAQRDLCLAIIQSTQARLNWPSIIAIMHDLGHTFTKDAASQHFTKVIAKDFKARHAQSIAGRGDGAADGTADVTPAARPKASPRKRGPKKEGGSTPKKRSKGGQQENQGSGSDAGEAGDGPSLGNSVPVKSEA